MLVLVALLSFAVAGGENGCAPPSEADCNEASMSCFVASVEKFWPSKDGRLGVAFRERAGIYYLREDSECFEEYREVFAKSLEARTPVKVLFRIRNQDVMAVAAVESQPSPDARPRDP